MRYQELFEADIHDERELLKMPNKTPLTVMQWLESNGFEKIGMGNFGAVFKKPNANRVVKIGTVPDPCYVAFTHTAMDFPRNPHLPKVYLNNHIKYEERGREKEFTLTIIEVLEPLLIPAARVRDDAQIYCLFTHPDVLWDAFYVTELMEKLKNPVLLKEIIRIVSEADENVARSLNSLTVDDFHHVAVKHAPQQFEQLTQTAKSSRLYKTITGVMDRGLVQRCHPDLHDENVMVRPSSGDLVLSDPIFDKRALF